MMEQLIERPRRRLRQKPRLPRKRPKPRKRKSAKKLRLLLQRLPLRLLARLLR